MRGAIQPFDASTPVVRVLADLKLTPNINTNLTTGWATEAGGLTAQFVAPATGRVKITIGAYLSTNTTNSRMDFGYSWTEGAIRPPLDEETVSIYSSAGASAMRACAVFTVPLVPGTRYTIASSVRNQVAASATVGANLRTLLIEAL